MQPQVGSKFRPLGLRVDRRKALVGVVVLLLLAAYLALSDVQALSSVPLQFTQFSGSGPKWVSVVAGPKGTVTYRLTLRNQSIIPIQVNGVEAVPGQPLTPVEVQVMPDEGDASAEPFRPFTLPPQESVYLLVTSPTVCGAQQDSLRLRYSVFGITYTSEVSLGGQIRVETFRCS